MVKACSLDLRVIMDNTSFHKSPRIRKIIENVGCQLRPVRRTSISIGHYWLGLKISFPTSGAMLPIFMTDIVSLLILIMELSLSSTLFGRDIVRRLYFGDIFELVHETPSFGDLCLLIIFVLIWTRDFRNSSKSAFQNFLRRPSFIDFSSGYWFVVIGCSDSISLFTLYSMGRSAWNFYIIP
jgi:hypothetical protein